MPSRNQLISINIANWHASCFPTRIETNPPILTMKLLAQAVAIAVLAFAAADASAVRFCPTPTPGIFGLGDAVNNGDGTYGYSYSVTGGGVNGCNLPIPTGDEPGILTDVYLPYFSDMGLTKILAPSGWTYGIEATNNLFGIGGGALHFMATTAQSFGAYGQFGYTSSFAGVEGPYAEGLVDPISGATHNFFGDPMIPGSPMTIAALFPQASAPSAVPEPGSIALLGLGLLGFALTRRKSTN